MTENWTPPDGFGYSGLRPVRLTAAGLAQFRQGPAALGVLPVHRPGAHLCSAPGRPAADLANAESGFERARTLRSRHWLGPLRPSQCSFASRCNFSRKGVPPRAL
jgi:hypothetical protein